MSTFRVGQKVVCVSKHPSHCDLVVGRIYIIHDISKCVCGNIGLNVGLPNVPGRMGTRCSLCGSKQGLSETGFYPRASRFRPLIEDLTASLAESEVKRQVIERPEHVNEPSFS